MDLPVSSILQSSMSSFGYRLKTWLPFLASAFVVSALPGISGMVRRIHVTMEL
jgi:hypothetical protein